MKINKQILLAGVIIAGLAFPVSSYAWGFDSVVTALAGAADNVIAALLSFIAMLALAMGASTLIFTLFFADIMIGIGLALGPLVLAFSVLSHFRGLLSNWTNFMFGAMATKVVAMIIASTMVAAMKNVQITGITAAAAGAQFANTGAMIGIIFLGVITTLIAKDADKIATGLFGGISTARGPTGGMMMGAGRATGSAGGKIAGGAATAANKIGGAAVGGSAGAAKGALTGGLAGAGAGLAKGAVSGGKAGLMSVAGKGAGTAVKSLQSKFSAAQAGKQQKG